MIERRAHLRIGPASRRALVVVVPLITVSLIMAIPASALTTQDAFDRPDGPIGTADSGQTWLQSKGAWVVDGGRARVSTQTPISFATIPVASPDVAISADITLSPTFRRASAGLTLLWRDVKNQLYVSLEVSQKKPGGAFTLGRKLNGVGTAALASRKNFGMTNGATYHVSVARSGAAITATVQGPGITSQVLSYTLTSGDLAGFGSATRAGLRSHFASDQDDGLSTWDNFVATDGTTSPTVTSSPTETPPPSTLTVVAVGDICGRSSKSISDCAATAALTQSLAPDVILAAGDIENTNEATIDDYRTAFAPRWASLLPLIQPVPGNHDYNNPLMSGGAEGYRAFFPDDVAPATGPLYHRFDMGNWHVVALDTDDCGATEECPRIDSTSTAQYQWMTADLADDTHTCDIVYGHHPAYSSPGGTRHGPTPWLQPAWDQMVASDVDLYISGHEHDYERFTRMDEDGAAAADGTRQFVVGTGGAPNDQFDSTILPTSEFHYTGIGVLVLTLTDDSYSWAFVTPAGVTLDQGGPVACH